MPGAKGACPPRQPGLQTWQKALPLPSVCGRVEGGVVRSMVHFGFFPHRRGEGLGGLVVEVLGKARQRKVQVGQSLQHSAKWSTSWETHLKLGSLAVEHIDKVTISRSESCYHFSIMILLLLYYHPNALPFFSSLRAYLPFFRKQVRIYCFIIKQFIDKIKVLLLPDIGELRLRKKKRLRCPPQFLLLLLLLTF